MSYLISLEFVYYSSFLIPGELKRQIRSYTPVVPSKTILPDSRPKWAKSIPVLRPERCKNHTFGAALTDMAHIRKYTPGSFTYQGRRNIPQNMTSGSCFKGVVLKHYSFKASRHLQWDEMFLHQTTNNGKTAFGSIIKSTVKKENLVLF